MKIIKKLFEIEELKSLSLQAKILYQYLIYKNTNKKDYLFTFAEVEQEKAVEYLHICTKTQRKALKELVDNEIIEKNTQKDLKTQRFKENKYKFKEEYL